MNPALRASAAHVFVDSISAPELAPDDEHHLFRVLRLREGESVTVCDGSGTWRETTVRGHGLEVAGEVERSLAPARLSVAAAIPKGDRLEWMVQKLTEIGVSEIVLLHCARSAVRWDATKAERQLARLRRIAHEASMQSRRLWLPVLSGPQTFEDAAAGDGAVLADPSGTPLDDASRVGIATVIIGPEGGFIPAELAVGRPVVAIGAQILRIETAAVAAAVKILL